MEDDLKKNGRQPKKHKNGRRPQAQLVGLVELMLSLCYRGGGVKPICFLVFLLDGLIIPKISCKFCLEVP